MKILLSYIFITTSLLAAPQIKSSQNNKKTLQSVYQKEIAFLLAQRRNLQKEIKNIRQEFNGKIKRSEIKIKKIEKSYVDLTTSNEKLVSDFAGLERNLESVQGNAGLVESTLTQARTTLNISEEELKKMETAEAKFSFLFSETNKILKEGGASKKMKGVFFLENGKKIEGEVLRLGNVAQFGRVSESDSFGMLMPVGEGRFKRLNKKTVELSHFDSSKMTPISTFLFENTEKGIEVKKEQRFLEMVDAGGMIAYVIMFLGLLAFIFMAIRGYLLFTAGKVSDDLINIVHSGDLSQIESAMEKEKTSLARVLSKTFNALDKDLEEREHIITESILGELSLLDRFGALILVMAAVAPLLGLLGTVTGMISTFDIITEFGTGDPKMLSSGISEALITTKLGLIVAIPALLIGNLFGGWSNKIKVMLEKEALRLSNLSSQSTESI